MGSSTVVVTDVVMGKRKCHRRSLVYGALVPALVLVEFGRQVVGPASCRIDTTDDLSESFETDMDCKTIARGKYFIQLAMVEASLVGRTMYTVQCLDTKHR